MVSADLLSGMWQTRYIIKICLLLKLKNGSDNWDIKKSLSSLKPYLVLNTGF